MRIENLKAYVCVLEEGSFTKAAERLRVTQSALSRQITELERSVGRPLISRTTRQVRVTPAGRILYAHAQRMLAEWDAAETKIRQLTDRPERLRLGCASAGLLSIAVDAAGKGCLEKGIDVSLSRVHPNRVVRMVRGGQLDCALAYRLSLPDEEGVEAAVLGSAAMTAAVRPTMLPAGKHALRMAQVNAWADVRCPAENGQAAYEAVDAAFRRAGLTPPPCIEAESYHDEEKLLLTERCMRIAPQTEPVPAGMTAWPVTDLRLNGDILLVWRTGDLRQETELVGEVLKAAVRQALSGDVQNGK